MKIKYLVFFACMFAFNKIAKSQPIPQYLLTNGKLFLGISNSHFIGETTFKQSLNRFAAQYRLDFKKDENHLVQLGLGYMNKGGSANDLLVYQSFKYIGLPIVYLRSYSTGNRLGFGITPSVLLQNATFIQGLRKKVNPNPYITNAPIVDIPVQIRYDLKLSPFVTLSTNAYCSSYPVSKVNAKNVWIWGLNAGIELNFSALRNEALKEANKINENEQRFLDFKNGTLVVLLLNKNPKVKALLQKGDTLESNELQEIVNQKNRQLMDAFRAYFDFCEVKFMPSENWAKLAQGDSTNVFISDSTYQVEVKRPLSPITVLNCGNIFMDEPGLTVGGYYFSTINKTRLYNPFPEQEVYMRVRDFDCEKFVQDLNISLFKIYARLSD